MEEEEKGFVIKDRRSFDKDGEIKEEKASEPAPSPEKEKRQEPKQSDAERPLPEVNFNSLIFSLSSSAFFNLGEIADPQTGQRQKDLPLAKHSIDILAMLSEKTKGNLDDEEQKFLDNILAELRIRYVKAIKNQ